MTFRTVRRVERSATRYVIGVHRRLSAARSFEALTHQIHERRDVIDLFRQVCEEERRTRTVISRRAKVSDPEARFLLALLMLGAVMTMIRLRQEETQRELDSIRRMAHAL